MASNPPVLKFYNLKFSGQHSVSPALALYMAAMRIVPQVCCGHTALFTSRDICLYYLEVSDLLA
jgi:hypothetical protein